MEAFRDETTQQLEQLADYERVAAECAEQVGDRYKELAGYVTQVGVWEAVEEYQNRHPEKPGAASSADIAKAIEANRAQAHSILDAVFLLKRNQGLAELEAEDVRNEMLSTEN